MLWILILIIFVLLILLYITSKPEEEKAEEIPVYICTECNETDCDCHKADQKKPKEPGGEL